MGLAPFPILIPLEHIHQAGQERKSHVATQILHLHIEPISFKAEFIQRIQQSFGTFANVLHVIMMTFLSTALRTVPWNAPRGLRSKLSH